jgi:hypothetical protein
VDTTYGVPVVHHGGSMIGYKSDMIFLPDHGVGAVILTNSDTGGRLLGPFRRKLLEVLFDGNPEADAQVAASARAMKEEIAAERKRLTVPADPAAAAALAAHYDNPDLDGLTVTHARGATIFTVGELRSEVASRRNDDGTTSFLTTVPGFDGLEFVAGDGTLLLHDAQHDYSFTATPAGPAAPADPGCMAYALMGSGVRLAATGALGKADQAAHRDIEAAFAAGEKQQYLVAARHWLACAARYRGLDDDMFAPVCAYNAIYSFASAGRLAAEGRAALLRVAKGDPSNAAFIYDQLATAPDDCKVR